MPNPCLEESQVNLPNCVQQPYFGCVTNERQQRFFLLTPVGKRTKDLVAALYFGNYSGRMRSEGVQNINRNSQDLEIVRCRDFNVIDKNVQI